MKRRPLTKEDLIEQNWFLLSIYHYELGGSKRRFFLPRLVKGSQVLTELRFLQKTHNVFRFKFHYSNFEHTPQIFSEVLATHDDWRARIDTYERRVPYLTSSLASSEEIEVLYV
jgi:hypothetical protein